MATTVSGYATLLTTAYGILSEDPGARLERERPGWFLNMKREPNDSLTVEARCSTSKAVLEENIPADNFRAAMLDRSQFVSVIQRAVASLIDRIPSPVVAVNESNKNRFEDWYRRRKKALTEGEFLLMAGHRGGKSDAVLRGAGVDMVVFDEMGQLPGVDTPTGTWIGIDRSTVPEFRMDGISGVSEQPQPEPLLPRPARVYCDD